MRFFHSVLVFAVAFCSLAPASDSRSQDVPAPQYRGAKVPLPNAWLVQGVPTMTTDNRDHIWIISRGNNSPVRTGALTQPSRSTASGLRRRA